MSVREILTSLIDVKRDDKGFLLSFNRLKQDLAKDGKASKALLARLQSDISQHTPQVLVAEQESSPFAQRLAEALGIPIIILPIDFAKIARLSDENIAILRTIKNTSQQVDPIRAVIFEDAVIEGKQSSAAATLLSYAHEQTNGDVSCQAHHVACIIEVDFGGRGRLRSKGITLSNIATWDPKAGFEFAGADDPSHPVFADALVRCENTR